MQVGGEICVSSLTLAITNNSSRHQISNSNYAGTLGALVVKFDLPA